VSTRGGTPFRRSEYSLEVTIPVGYPRYRQYPVVTGPLLDAANLCSAKGSEAVP
jgi:hypothetical protein